MPTFATGDPRLEKRDLERHDPFPSRTAAPDTQTRPRGFNVQRSEIRRIREEDALRGLQRRQEVPANKIPTSQLEYPQSVR